MLSFSFIKIFIHLKWTVGKTKRSNFSYWIRKKVNEKNKIKFDIIFQFFHENDINKYNNIRDINIYYHYWMISRDNRKTKNTNLIRFRFIIYFYYYVFHVLFLFMMAVIPEKRAFRIRTVSHFRTVTVNVMNGFSSFPRYFDAGKRVCSKGSHYLASAE